MKKILSVFAIAVMGGVAALGLNQLFFKPATLAGNANTQAQMHYTNAVSTGAPIDFRDAAEGTVHAVVHILTKFTTQQTYYAPFQGFFGGNFFFEKMSTKNFLRTFFFEIFFFEIFFFVLKVFFWILQTL